MITNFSDRTRLWFFGVCVLAILLGAIIPFVSNWISIQKEGNYDLLFLPVVLIFIAFLLVTQNMRKKNVDLLSMPSIFFLIIVFYYVVLGSLSQYLRVLSSYPLNYTESLKESYILSSLALVGWMVGYVIASRFINDRFIFLKELEWRKGRFLQMTVVWLIGGIGLMAYFLFGVIGGVPSLNGLIGNVDKGLSAVIENEGRFISVAAFNANNIGLWLGAIYLATYGFHWAVSALFIMGILFFVGWGPRLYFVIPLLVAGLMYIRIKRLKVWIISIVTIVFFLALVFFGWWRNRQMFQIDRTSVVSTLAYVNLSPEYREFLGVIRYKDTLSKYFSPTSFFRAIYLPMLPGSVWSKLSDVNKNDIFSQSSAWIIADVVKNNTWTGIRAGVLGELLMAFGPNGIFVGLLLLGILFSVLDKIVINVSSDALLLGLVYYVSVLFSLLMVGQVESTFIRLWYGLYAYILIALFSFKKRKR